MPGQWTVRHRRSSRFQHRRAAVAGVKAVVHVAALHAPHVAQVPNEEFRAVEHRSPTPFTEAAGGVHMSFRLHQRHVGLRPLPRFRRPSVCRSSLHRVHVTSTTKRNWRLKPSSQRLQLQRPCSRPWAAPEPLPLLARHRLHRGVGVSDVAAAHVRALAKTQVTSILNVAGPLLFDKSDATELYHCSGDKVLDVAGPPSAAGVSPYGAEPLPDRLDRVYDSRAAAVEPRLQTHRGILRPLSY